jgi:hypothetical protein
MLATKIRICVLFGVALTVVIWGISDMADIDPGWAGHAGL